MAGTFDVTTLQKYQECSPDPAGWWPRTAAIRWHRLGEYSFLDPKKTDADWEPVRLISRGLPWGVWGADGKPLAAYTCGPDCISVVAKRMQLHGPESAAIRGLEHYRYLDSLVLGNRRRAIVTAAERAETQESIPQAIADAVHSGLPRLFADLIALDWDGMTRTALWKAKVPFWNRILTLKNAHADGTNPGTVWSHLVEMDPLANSEIAGCYYCATCKIHFGYTKKPGDKLQPIFRTTDSVIGPAVLKEENHVPTERPQCAFESHPAIDVGLKAPEAKELKGNYYDTIQEGIQAYVTNPKTLPEQRDTISGQVLCCPNCKSSELGPGRVFGKLPKFLAIHTPVPHSEEKKRMKITQVKEKDLEFEAPVYVSGGPYPLQRHRYRWYGGIYYIVRKNHFVLYLAPQDSGVHGVDYYDGMGPEKNSCEGPVLSGVGPRDGGHMISLPMREHPVLLFFEHIHTKNFKGQERANSYYTCCQERPKPKPKGKEGETEGETEEERKRKAKEKAEEERKRKQKEEEEKAEEERKKKAKKEEEEERKRKEKKEKEKAEEERKRKVKKAEEERKRKAKEEEEERKRKEREKAEEERKKKAKEEEEKNKGNKKGSSGKGKETAPEPGKTGTKRKAKKPQEAPPPPKRRSRRRRDGDGGNETYKNLLSTGATAPKGR